MFFKVVIESSIGILEECVAKDLERCTLWLSTEADVGSTSKLSSEFTATMSNLLVSFVGADGVGGEHGEGGNGGGGNGGEDGGGEGGSKKFMFTSTMFVKLEQV